MVEEKSIEEYLIEKAWSIRRTGEFLDWEKVRDAI
jgi:hypothetical protein